MSFAIADCSTVPRLTSEIHQIASRPREPKTAKEAASTLLAFFGTAASLALAIRAVARLSALAALSLAPLLSAGIRVVGPGSLSLPFLMVSPHPLSISSDQYVVRLSNPDVEKGWLLSGEVFNGALEGVASGEKINAELTFKSITLARGERGSPNGLFIHSDGKRVEADPGFGLGEYEIVFEVRFDVPALARADRYYGVSTFFVQ